MANGWDGADPVQQDDGSGTYLELGQAATIVDDVTITAVRVWHGAASFALAGRKARIWSTGGAVLADITLDASLPSGWTTYNLPAPLERTAGSQIIVSYSTRQYYGFTAGGYPNASADGAVEYTGGRFAESPLFPFPESTSSSFYGVDLVYTPGIGGNVAPDVALTVAVAGMVATATVTVEDEAPGSMSYVYHWGDGTTTSTSSTTAQHTYASHGLYAVFVVGTDVGGLSGVDARPVLIAQAGGGMDVQAVMEELGGRLRTVDGLEVFDYPPDRITRTPAAIVAYPESITYDAGGRRSTDMLRVPIVVAIARVADRARAEAAAPYASGFGARSIKEVLEGGVPAYSTMRGLIIKEGLYDVITIGGIDYIAVVHTATIGG